MFEFQTLSASDLRDPEISALIAAKLKEFHELDMPGPKRVTLWNRLRYPFNSYSNITWKTRYFVVFCMLTALLNLQGLVEYRETLMSTTTSTGISLVCTRGRNLRTGKEAFNQQTYRVLPQ